jgi:predicted deacetylase
VSNSLIRMEPQQTIAVALHGIEPATFERCALIRDWLEDHGIDRVTLLVIPARDMHPVGERSPAMIQWLSDQRRAGDSIAQHGFHHQGQRRSTLPRRMLVPTQSHGSAEFVGLDGEEARRAVEAGWRVLKLAGIEPDGFVAPAYAYTTALREALSLRFQWWAGLLRLYRASAYTACTAGEPFAPAWTLASGSPLRRALSPSLIRLGSRLPGSTLRLDLHPADLDHPRHMIALERLLGRVAGSRSAITYQELAGI